MRNTSAEETRRGRGFVRKTGKKPRTNFSQGRACGRERKSGSLKPTNFDWRSLKTWRGFPGEW